MRIIRRSKNRRELGHVPQLFRHAPVAQALLPVRLLDPGAITAAGATEYLARFVMAIGVQSMLDMHGSPPKNGDTQDMLPDPPPDDPTQDAAISAASPQNVRLTTNIPAALSFFPRAEESIDYAVFKAKRGALLAIIRGNEPEQVQAVTAVVDALIELDPELPTGTLAALKTVLKLGKTVRERARRRELYAQVVSSLLEKLFDPFLEFKMTKKDILDTFQARGLDRERIQHSQIDTIYVMVKENLQTGPLRDMTFQDPDLALYVRMKIRELEWSRTQWRIDS